MRKQKEKVKLRLKKAKNKNRHAKQKQKKCTHNTTTRIIFIRTQNNTTTRIIFIRRPITDTSINRQDSHRLSTGTLRGSGINRQGSHRLSTGTLNGSGLILILIALLPFGDILPTITPLQGGF